MDRKLRIGIVGASMDGGWAHRAHMPALMAIPEIEIAAIVTSGPESAARSAAHYGIANGFSDLAPLLASDVDLVVVSVKAPEHFSIAEQVLESGMMLFVEWPMGASLEQSACLVRMAEQRGLRGFVGLQARAAPGIRHAAELIADGYLGKIHSVSMQGTYSYWGNPVTTAYSADHASGASILTIPAGHGLDLMRLLAGEVATVNGRTSHSREQVFAQDSGTMVAMTAPDQVAAIGTLASGAVFSAHFDGMALTGESFRMTLNGDEGEMVICGDGMPEIARLRLFGTCRKGARPSPIEVPGTTPFAPDHPASNVALLWQMIARDLLQGTSYAPTLASGCATRTLLDAIEQSARNGGETIAIT